MPRTSVLRSPTIEKAYPPDLQFMTMDSRSRVSAAAYNAWPPEELNSPPPYELYDVYPALPVPVTYAADTHPISPRRTHDIPSTMPQVQTLRSPISGRSRRTQPSMSIPHLREALDSLEDRMATLLNERERLETRLEHAVRMQSPVQRLPSELLASIFVNGVFDQGEEDAVLLANIMLACRYWREVAVGTPALWSRIFMGPRRSLDRARLKLERSKSFPLHICVDFSPQSEHRTVATETLMHAMDLLRSAMWRWRSFQLSVPERPQAHAALSRCKEEAPLLEVFSVRIANSMQHDDRHPGQPLFLFAGRTPRLRSCAFNSYNFGWDPRLASGLRVLKLSGYWNNAAPSLDDLLAILRASPQLEELALRNMSDVDQGACGVTDIDPDRPIRVADSRMVYLPRLTRASFYYAGPLRVRTLLSLLTFPALERIELGYMDDVSAIVEYLRRQSLTSLPLRHLKIESCLFNEFKLVSLLMRFTSLATLELIDVEDVSSYTLRVRDRFRITLDFRLQSRGRALRHHSLHNRGCVRSSPRSTWRAAPASSGKHFAPLSSHGYLHNLARSLGNSAHRLALFLDR